MKILSLFALFFCVTGSSYIKETKKIEIDWRQKLEGDFSFAKKKSIVCDAWCYEWAGTNGIIAKQRGKDTVECYTLMNASTHCSLHFLITGDSCVPTIVLNSIVAGASRIYEGKDGFISIDRKLWEGRILKATFALNFKNPENEKKIYWNGNIFTKIK